MLNLGVDSMALRYPVALGCAYLFFLFLIRLWLRTKPGDYLVDVGVWGGPSGTGSSQAPLSYALFNRLRREQERRHWLTSTLRLTMLPFVMTAIFLGVAGYALEIHTPGAKSIGQVMARGN